MGVDVRPHRLLDSHKWLNQLGADALMVSLAMVVGHELGYGATKMPLPQQDHAIEALLPRQYRVQPSSLAVA
jgi:hypothetical protein